jgi:Mrp family chromosome partitioning ATPase/capsular polysaccharide biosynthesis protein
VSTGSNGNGNGKGYGYYAASGPGHADTSSPQPSSPPPAYTPEPEPEGMTLRDYLGVVWRRKWLIVLVVLVATASAYYFASRQEKQYSTSGTMFYKQQIDLSNPLGGSYTDTMGLNREMATINDLMAGPDITSSAQAALKKKGTDTAAGYTITAQQQSTGSGSSSTDSGSNVVVVTGDSTDPRLATSAVNAYMAAFVDWDAQQWRDQIKKALPVVEGQLAQYKTKQAKLTTDYVMLKQRYQDLLILGKTTNGSYRILMPAQVPTVPYAPNPIRSAMLGFAVGLFAGIGLAFLLEQFDTRIRRPDQIAQFLRLPILGRVPRIKRRELGESALVTLHHPEGHIAEAFRMVRTNLDFMAVDGDIKSIVLSSCIKGEGKSVAVANLAVSMALAGKKVIVVDGDLRRPRMHKYFELDNSKGVSTVATGQHSLSEALHAVGVEPPPDGKHKTDFAEWAKGTDALARLYVLPSGPIPPNPGEIVSGRRFAAIIEDLSEEADLVLVDSPAMLAVGDTSAIASKVDGLVFLVDMELIKRPQLVSAADQLYRLPVRLLGSVVRIHHKRSERYYYHSPYYYYGYSYTEDGRKVKDRRRGSHQGRRASDRAGDRTLTS